MQTLEPLRAAHAAEVLAFEQANRAYFASSVADRGQSYFEEFNERLAALLAEQQAGVCAFYLLVVDDGAVLGRFNLYDLHEGSAAVGYRVAEHVAGRGVATAGLRQLGQVAQAQHGLHTLTASITHQNEASQRVLAKAGFLGVGPADPADLGGSPGTQYRLDLTLANAPDGSGDSR